VSCHTALLLGVSGGREGYCDKGIPDINSLETALQQSVILHYSNQVLLGSQCIGVVGMIRKYKHQLQGHT
jgi:hypothetical protein